MGNDTSKIDLSRENSQYKTDQYANVTVKPGNWDDNKFKKYTQSIKYYVEAYSWWNRKYFYLSFSKRWDTKGVYYFYPDKTENIIDQIEVYFSNLHTDIPLILGFKTKSNDTFKYYKYTDLRDKVKSSTELPEEKYQINDLNSELKKENERRNKIKFTIDGLSENYIEKLDDKSYGDFMQYKYIVNEQKTYESYNLSTDMLFKYEDGNITETSFLGSVNNGLFDYICSYYTKRTKTLVFLEFVNDSDKKYFKREDAEGESWKDHEFNYYNEGTVKDQLEQIKSSYENRITYRLEKNSINGKLIYKSIAVSNQKKLDHKYVIYVHTPTKPSSLGSTIVLYKGQKIKIVENTKISSDGDRIRSLEQGIFTEIWTYSLDINEIEHLLIKLTKKGNVYFLYRFDKEGTMWKQLDLEYLKKLNIITKEYEETIRGVSKGEAMGQRLNRFLSHDKSNYLKTMLQDISGTINSIVILIDYKIQYGKTKINSIIGTNNQISSIHLNNSIYVQNVDDASEYCTNIPGYTIYRHDFSKLVEDGELRARPSPLYIRLYSKNMRIWLFDDSRVEQPPCYLTYSKKSTDIFVYFCEGKNDPLLVLYNDNCYKPKDKGNKNTKWIRVPNVKNCKNVVQIKRELEKIKKELCPQTETSHHPSTQGQPTTQGTAEVPGASSNSEQSASSGIEGNQATDQRDEKQSTNLEPNIGQSSLPTGSSGIDNNRPSPPGDQQEIGKKDIPELKSPRTNGESGKTVSDSEPAQTTVSDDLSPEQEGFTRLNSDDLSDNHGTGMQSNLNYPGSNYFPSSKNQNSGFEQSEQIENPIPGGLGGLVLIGGLVIMGAVGGHFLYKKCCRFKHSL